MQPVRIEAKAWDDPYFVKLGQRIGMHEWDVLIRMCRVWGHCTEQGTCSLAADDVDACVRIPGFAAHMVAAGLGVILGDGKIEIAGAKKRLGWLRAMREGAERGGKANADRLKAKRNHSDTIGAKGKPRATTGLAPEDSPVVAPMDPSYSYSGSGSFSDSDSGSDSGSSKPPSEVQKNCADALPETPHSQLKAEYFRLYSQAAHGTAPGWTGKHARHCSDLLKRAGLAECLARLRSLYASPPEWITGLPDFGTFYSCFDKLAASSVSPRSKSRSPSIQDLNELQEKLRSQGL